MSEDGGESDRSWETTLLGVWSEAQRRSMVGPGDPRVHLELARRLTRLLDPPDDALDLGSGAGIPGLALAGLWPASRWTLVDAAQRRTVMLERAVERLGWGDRVHVVHARAEDLGRVPGHRERYDLVTARSFGPPAVTAECGGAFVRVGGLLVVTEPPADDRSRWPVEPLAVLGLATAPAVRPAGCEATEPGGGTGDADMRVEVLRRIRPLDERFPRRAGVPSKRPLY